VAILVLPQTTKKPLRHFRKIGKDRDRKKPMEKRKKRSSIEEKEQKRMIHHTQAGRYGYDSHIMGALV